jgi:hypothetical protein
VFDEGSDFFQSHALSEAKPMPLSKAIKILTQFLQNTGLPRWPFAYTVHDSDATA